MKQRNPKMIKLCLIPGAETFALEAFMGKHRRMPVSIGTDLQGALSLEHILFFLKLQRGVVESKPFGRIAPARESTILY